MFLASRYIAVILPGTVIIGLMVWQIVAMHVRDSRGRKLFMRETGASKKDWQALAPNRQRKWIQADRDDLELTKFAADLKKSRTAK